MKRQLLEALIKAIQKSDDFAASMIVTQLNRLGLDNDTIKTLIQG
jgi:hypothetical protein